VTTKISYLHGFSDDCYKSTGLTYGDWTETEAAGCTGALTVDSDDFFKIAATIMAGDKYVYYSYPNEAGADNLSLKQSDYPICFWQFRCSNANIKAKIVLVDSDGTPHTMLPDTNSETWKFGSAYITSGKTVDHVRLYATSATGDVYYDFFLISKIMTFPYVAKDGKSGGIHLHLEREDGYLDALNRDGAIIQDGGLATPEIILEGDMDTNTSWLTSPIGQAIYYIMKSTDQWQWFESDLINCKVKPAMFDIYQVPGSGKQRLWTLKLREYSRSSGKNSQWTLLSWLGF